MKLIFFSIATLLMTAFFKPSAMAQVDSVGPYVLKPVKDIDVTSVKDQARSGTCWSFAATSFIEAEILRKGNDSLDLSEMYFVREAYPAKADLYVRYHGSSNYSPGGQAHDVLNVVRESGFIPEDYYNGLVLGDDHHVHGELDAISQAYLDAVIKNRNRKLSPVWPEAFNGLMDAYLGNVPEKFDYQGKEYDLSSFVEEMDFNPDEYVELTSYLHHDFYKAFVLEIPDNWSHDLYYNVPLDELMAVINKSLEMGYTVCWDGDVSDKGFSHRNGLAILPDQELKEMEGSERSRWEKLSEAEKRKELYSFEKLVQEKDITAEMRQKHFDNYSSTDDHLMHLTGLYKDQDGKFFYKTKNSWAGDSNKFGGYLFMSEPYLKLNTVAVLVHKDVLPKELKKKLNID